MPAPSRSTLPHISWPKVRSLGSAPYVSFISPRQMCTVEPHPPARVSLIRIAAGSGSCTGYSRSSNSPPYALSTATRPFIEAPPWNGFSERVAARGPRCQHPGPRVGWGGFRDLKEETVKLLLFHAYRLGVLRCDPAVIDPDTAKD